MNGTATTAATKGKQSPPVLALGATDAAAALGISRAGFDRHVRPNVKAVQIGGRKLYPLRELERYIDRNAAVPLAEWLNR
jgi:hypothetical protein